MIRAKATDDGTYTVYRDQTALLCGLTRAQADELITVLATPAQNT
jgi:hypothetical protein